MIDQPVLDEPTGDDSVIVGIGIAIRAHRQSAGLSMRELAARAGMSQPFLSNLENARAMPSIATLYKLATALGIGPQDFLPGAPDPQITLVRNGQGAETRVGDEPDSAVSRLVAGSPGRMIEAHTYVVAPQDTVGGWFEHDGEDLLTVLSGRLLVEFVDGRAFELNAGDVLWHVSNLGHRWSPLGRGVAELLLVNARPSNSPARVARPEDRTH